MHSPRRPEASCARAFRTLGAGMLLALLALRAPGQAAAGDVASTVVDEAGRAVAGARAGLSMDNFYSAQLHDRVAYHDFEGITVHADEGPRLLRSIGNRPAVILRNHGLLSWGRTIEQAFVVLWTLQRACEVQVAGAALGPTISISEAVQRKCSADALQFHPEHGGGRDVFDAMVRLVDRIDPSYRD